MKQKSKWNVTSSCFSEIQQNCKICWKLLILYLECTEVNRDTLGQTVADIEISQWVTDHLPLLLFTAWWKGSKCLLLWSITSYWYMTHIWPHSSVPYVMTSRDTLRGNEQSHKHTDCIYPRIRRDKLPVSPFHTHLLCCLIRKHVWPHREPSVCDCRFDMPVMFSHTRCWPTAWAKYKLHTLSQSISRKTTKLADKGKAIARSHDFRWFRKTDCRSADIRADLTRQPWLSLRTFSY